MSISSLLFCFGDSTAAEKSYCLYTTTSERSALYSWAEIFMANSPVGFYLLIFDETFTYVQNESGLFLACPIYSHGS